MASSLPQVNSASNLRKKTSEMLNGNENQTIICRIFWKPQLAFSEYKHGDKLVEFKSLWPQYAAVKRQLIDTMEDTGLRSALWELCVLVMVDGPVSVIQALIDMKCLRIDNQFDNDPGLLHLACVMQNIEAIQIITQLGVSSKIKDKSGKTADEVCFSPKAKKYLPLKLQTPFLAEKNKMDPSLQDKEAIFKLASNPKSLYELQKKIQMFDFQVNEEQKDGDYLIHIAAKTGICQLPLLMSLVHLQNANINLCNADGMTSLMIFASEGDCNMCDVLMCVLGANPNVKNSENGRTALHYAVLNGHGNIVSCLIRRGADVNIEDNDQCRPDDLMLQGNPTEECRQVIQLERTERANQLSQKVKSDAVYPVELRTSDLSIIDDESNTLIMIAAQSNRIHNLGSLLLISTHTINAQHSKTGMTALAMAAQAGNAECCDLLLQKDANANIQDMKGYIPLHYAVLNNQENVISVFSQHFPNAYVGLFKAMKMSKNSGIYDQLKKMHDRRQYEMVQQQLSMTAIDGDAEKLFCLLEDGDNVNLKGSENSQPAMFVAIENRHTDVVKLLVERDADLKKRDSNTGNTVLHTVAETGDLDTAEYLLQFCDAGNQSHSKTRLDINAVNNKKETALQIAAAKGSISLMRMLVEHGATTAVLDSQGSLFTSANYEGARVLIERYRDEHTRIVMKLVAEKPKKGLAKLKKVWLPRFDHNLRDKNGYTPLMVACKCGRVEVVKFLLQTAVYANHIIDEETEHSDDSGVAGFQPWKSHLDASAHEDLMKSVDKSGDENVHLGATYRTSRSLTPGAGINKLVRGVSMERGEKLQSFLTDVERPKGLYIFHGSDGIVSHVCAVNLFDGNTPLHCTLEGGDYVDIAVMLLEADSAVVNMQNCDGLTPVHLACKLGRKKILEKLLCVRGVDLGLVTLNCDPPEKLTKNKTLIKMVQNARKSQPPENNPRASDGANSAYLTESLPSVSASMASDTGASTVNFDRLQDIYTSMRTQQTTEQREENKEN